MLKSHRPSTSRKRKHLSHLWKYFPHVTKFKEISLKFFFQGDFHVLLEPIRGEFFHDLKFDWSLVCSFTAHTVH